MINKLLESYDNIPVPGTSNNSGNGIQSGDFNKYKAPNGSMSSSNPKFQVYRQQIVGDSDKLKEQCAKRILLDVYTKVLPFDDGYCDGKQGIMVKDIDNFLADKKTTGLQYLKSAYESTKAPLLEFVIRSINSIGSEYMEGAIQKLKEDADNGMDVPPTPADTDTDSVDGQIIDVKKDLEYEDFIEKLKKKTVSKIVSDISELLKDKKDEKDMSFSLKTEASSFKIAMDYITEWTMKNSKEVGNQDDMIGLAIRESTLNTFDVLFRQRGSSINEYTSKIRFGKGVVINESALVEQYVNFNLGDDTQSRVLSPDTDLDNSDSYIEGYNILMLEYESYMNSEIASFMEATVGSKIIKGIKWLIDKIIAFAKKIGNAIKNIFKPKAEKQLKVLEIQAGTVSKALDSVGIKSSNVINKSSVKNAPIVVRKITAADLGQKAKDGHVMKHANGEIINVKNGSGIARLNRVFLDNTEFKKKFDRYVLPLIESKFSNRMLILTAKAAIGEDALTYPIFTGNAYSPVSVDIDKFFAESNELTEYIVNVLNMSQIKEMENDPNVDPYFSVVLNATLTVLNLINIRLRDINDCINYKFNNPYDDLELNAIKDRRVLGEIIEYIILKSDIKNTIVAYNIIKPFIRVVCKMKKWIDDDDSAPSGASRIVILTSDSDNVIYKYAWNRKGIFDNKLDLKIKDAVSADRNLSANFALPTNDSSDSGVYIVVPRAKLRSVSGAEIDRFKDKLKDLIGIGKVKLGIADLHEDNVGFMNGKMVVVDYGNFKVY